MAMTLISATNGHAALELAPVGEARPRAARRDDAAARRSRRLQTAPRAGGDGSPARDHAHRERGLREDRRRSRRARTTSSRSRSTATELLTRIRSLLRIKRYHDTIKAQAAELLDLNQTLEERVRTQLDELERLQRLRRFLSPQLANAIVSTGDESILRSHRRQVSMFFADLRGWTSFVDSVEPEELMRVLGEFHGTIGGLVRRFDATVGGHRGRRRPALLQRSDRGARSRVAGSSPGVRAQGGDGRADGASGRSADTTSTSAPASRSATRPVARSASRAAPTTRRSER